MFLSFKKAVPTSTTLTPVDPQPGSRLIGRLRRRQTEVQCERDMVTILATLARLNERQLNRIGLSRSTLAFDIDEMAERTAREQAIDHGFLRVVTTEGSPVIAAE